MGIPGQEKLTIIKNKKIRKYDFLASELPLLYKCKTQIVFYAMTLDGLVTKYYSEYLTKLKIPMKINTYRQFTVLRKTLKLISLETRRGLDKIELDGASKRSINRLYSARMRLMGKRMIKTSNVNS